MSPELGCPSFLELDELASGLSHGSRASWISEHASSRRKCANELSEIRADRDLESRLQRAFSPDAKRASSTLPAIDGYHILRELGRGGMGVVFEAKQISPPRTVALKVVRGAQYVAETTLRLFQREIRVLARLEHPGIAGLFGAGSTSTGEHYFAMELVHGRSLVAHGKELDRRARLELFRQLCDAIDCAHQRGVVHRDLKPSNVLVTGDGRVKVLDFGLANITDHDVSQSSLVTEAGQIRGTLAYMSPEQARGDPSAIDLRSDVYSLGVILFELLTGKLPTDVFNLHIQEAARRVCEDAPMRPSAIDASLRGDLETIVLKALEKEPARRYASAATFREDVRRFLDQEVILARPPSATYELHKFVLRHKLPCALAASIFVMSIVTALWTGMLYQRESKLRLEADKETTAANEARAAETSAKESAQAAQAVALEQAQRADKEAERARREAQTSERVKDFLLGVFGASSYAERTTKQITADELLQRGVERIQSELVEDRHVRAALLSSLGRVCLGLHMTSRAGPLIEESVRILRQESPGSQELGRALTILGILREQSGDPRAAILLQEEALSILEATGNSGDHDKRGVRGNLAQALYATGEYSRAAQLYRDCLAELRAIGEQGQREYCNLQVSLGVTLFELGKYEEGESVLRDSIATLRPLGVSMTLANAINTLGMILYGRRDNDGAQANYEDSLRMKLELLDPASELIASSYNNLAAVRNQRGDPKGALEYLGQSRDILAQNHPEGALALAMNDCNRGRANLKLGDLESAAKLADAALEARRASLGNQHGEVADSLVLVAEIRLKRREFPSAEEALLEALPILDARLGRENIQTINARFRLGQVRQAGKNWPAAEGPTLEALEDLRGVVGNQTAVRAAICAQLVGIYEGWGKPEEAEKYKSPPAAKR